MNRNVRERRVRGRRAGFRAIFLPERRSNSQIGNRGATPVRTDQQNWTQKPIVSTLPPRVPFFRHALCIGGLVLLRCMAPSVTKAESLRGKLKAFRLEAENPLGESRRLTPPQGRVKVTWEGRRESRRVGRPSIKTQSFKENPTEGGGVGGGKQKSERPRWREKARTETCGRDG